MYEKFRETEYVYSFLGAIFILRKVVLAFSRPPTHPCKE